MAARQMCFVCQVMLNSGFSDELSVKFDQALRRFEAACQQELAAGTEAPVWPGEETTADISTADTSDETDVTAADERRRRYLNVMR